MLNSLAYFGQRENLQDKWITKQTYISAILSKLIR